MGAFEPPSRKGTRGWRNNNGVEPPRHQGRPWVWAAAGARCPAEMVSRDRRSAATRRPPRHQDRQGASDGETEDQVTVGRDTLGLGSAPLGREPIPAGRGVAFPARPGRMQGARRRQCPWRSSGEFRGHSTELSLTGWVYAGACRDHPGLPSSGLIYC